MLMGCGVIDNIRVIVLEYLLHPVGIPHGSNQHHQVQLRIFSHQLLLNVIGIILINVQDQKLSGLMARNLSAQLAAYGTAAPCHHDNLAADVSHDLVHICLDSLPAQEVFDFHFLQLGHGYLTVDQLIGARNGPEFASRLLTDIQNAFPHLVICGRNGKNNLVYPVFRHCIQNFIPASHNGNSPQKLSLTSHFVIYDAFHTQILAGLDFLYNHVGRRPCADNHHIHLIIPRKDAGSLGIQNTQNAVTEPDHTGKCKQKKPVKHIVASGHQPAGHIAENHLCQGRAAGGKRNIDQFRGAGIPPDTLI